MGGGMQGVKGSQAAPKTRALDTLHPTTKAPGLIRGKGGFREGAMLRLPLVGPQQEPKLEQGRIALDKQWPSHGSRARQQAQSSG
jgi:hypothetical protein